NDDIEIPLAERAKRVIKLLQAIKLLYRDIKGRRENLSPIFAIGGVYNYKNPFFENRLKLSENKLNVSTIENVLELDEEIKNNTKVGLVRGIFANDEEIESKLNPLPMAEFFKTLESEVLEYYK